MDVSTLTTPFLKNWPFISSNYNTSYCSDMAVVANEEFSQLRPEAFQQLSFLSL